VEHGTKTEAPLDINIFTLGSLFTPIQRPPASNPSGGMYTPSPMQCCGEGFRHTLEILRGKVPPNPLTRTENDLRSPIERMLNWEYRDEK
jgi:hypothetical protein